MDTMDCSQTRNLLSDFHDGTMDAASAGVLAAHLRGCGECAGADASFLAVRGFLRGLPPDPAPPELLPGVLAAVEAEDRNARPGSAHGGADRTIPFLSRFRVPLEAAAALLLFASVYWYQRIPAPAARPPSGISSEAAKVPASRPAAGENAAKGSPPAPRRVQEEPKTASAAAPPAPKPRTWTAADLPSVPAYFASTDSERIVPVAPPRPLSTLPYGRDIVVEVNPGSREGAEERIVEATIRSGGIVERIERRGGAGTVRVIVPEAAAGGFLDELRRIGTVPPGGMPEAIDVPAGPRPGTVAYAVRIRAR